MMTHSIVMWLSETPQPRGYLLTRTRVMTFLALDAAPASGCQWDISLVYSNVVTQGG